MGAALDHHLADSDCDHGLRLAGFANYIRARITISRGDAPASHVVVDFHSEVVDGVRVCIDTPVTKADRDGIRKLCAVAHALVNAPNVALMAFQVIVTDYWGADLGEAIGTALEQGLDEEDMSSARAAFVASLAAKHILITGQ